MEKNRRRYIGRKKHTIRKIGVMLLCAFMVLNTVLSPINSYAYELYEVNEDADVQISYDVSGDDGQDDESLKIVESEDLTDVVADDDVPMETDGTNTVAESDYDTENAADDNMLSAETGADETVTDETETDDENSETLADETKIAEEYIETDSEIDPETRIVDGSTISSAMFYSYLETWYSWRANWSNTSFANSNRKNDFGSTFKGYCISNLSDKSQACNDYVMNVLKSSGEMSSSEYLTASGGTFEDWLLRNSYYSVYGDYIQMVTGASGSKSYTSIAKDIIGNIRNGDILLWAYENSDGSFSTKHISIGVTYTDDLAPYVDNKETLVTGEACVFQSNGGSLSGGSSDVGVESIAYYLSGANSTTSYGTALKIYRRDMMTGSVQVKKATVTGDNKDGVVFGLYKVSVSGKSYMDTTNYLNVSSLDLSGLSDTVVSADSGMLTKVATFTTNSEGIGVARLTTGIQNIHNNSSSRGGDWYYINVSSDGYKISGLPLGDYILIEEPDTTSKSYWTKGGTYENVVLGANTVNTSWEVTQAQGKYVSINGVYNKIHTNDTSNKSVNKLCDFGLGQGLQYYAAFSLENSSNLNNYSVEALAYNVDSKINLKLAKSSADTNITGNNSCYLLKKATYAVYNNTTGKGAGSAKAATESNYKTLEGYTGELITDGNGNSNVLSGLSVGVYYVKEVITPYGYAKDTNVYTIDLSDETKLNNGVYELKVSDKPQVNPVNLIVRKYDGLKNQPLEGAEFTVKFYGATYGKNVDPKTLGAKPLRTWVIKTDKDGNAKADNSHKVSGDAWYTYSSKVVFPLGTVTIQETKAPAGYLLDENVYVYAITGSGSGETLSVYNAPKITDVPIPDIETSATDSKSGTRNSQTAEKTVIYDDVYMTKLMTGKTYTIKGVLMDKETGEKLVAGGEYVTAEETFVAKESTMTVRMTYEFNSLELKGKETVVFEDLYENGKKIAVHSDLEDEDQTVYIDETKVGVTKVDSSTGEAVAGAVLALYDNDDSLVERWVSDTEEHLLLNLLPGTYRLVEEETPEGYKVSEDIEFELDYSFRKLSITMEDDVITGGVRVIKSDSVNPDRKLKGVTFLMYKKSDTVMDTGIDRKFLEVWSNISENEINENETEEIYKEVTESGTIMRYMAETGIAKTIKDNKLNENDLYIGTFVTDEEGMFTVDNLSYGSYYLVEIETLDTYELLTDPVDFEIDAEHTENELYIENVAHEGWVLYGGETKTIPEIKEGNVKTESEKSPSVKTKSAKTGDETEVLWIMVLLMTSFGMIIVLVRRRKNTRELLVISAVAGVMAAGFLNNIGILTANAAETVRLEKDLDTGYCDTEPEHDEYITENYTDEATGTQYSVELSFVESECIESSYAVPVELTGTIGDYKAEYIVYKGKRYDNPGENLESMAEMMADFVADSGYTSESYGELTYDYDGESYVGEDGVTYRNFKINFMAYGNRYRFHYAGILNLLSVDTDNNDVPNETSASSGASTTSGTLATSGISDANEIYDANALSVAEQGEKDTSKSRAEISVKNSIGDNSGEITADTIKDENEVAETPDETSENGETGESDETGAVETNESQVAETDETDETTVIQTDTADKIFNAVLLIVLTGSVVTCVLIKKRRAVPT